MTDEELQDMLREIAELHESRFTDWEREFVENVAFTLYGCELTDAQRSRALAIIAEYGEESDDV